MFLKSSKTTVYLTAHQPAGGFPPRCDPVAGYLPRKVSYSYAFR